MPSERPMTWDELASQNTRLKADLKILWEAIFAGRDHLHYWVRPTASHLCRIELKEECRGDNEALGLRRMVSRAQEMTEKYPHLREAAKAMGAPDLTSDDKAG